MPKKVNSRPLTNNEMNKLVLNLLKEEQNGHNVISGDLFKPVKRGIHFSKQTISEALGLITCCALFQICPYFIHDYVPMILVRAGMILLAFLEIQNSSTFGTIFEEPFTESYNDICYSVHNNLVISALNNSKLKDDLSRDLIFARIIGKEFDAWNIMDKAKIDKYAKTTSKTYNYKKAKQLANSVDNEIKQTIIKPYLEENIIQKKVEKANAS